MFKRTAIAEENERVEIGRRDIKIIIQVLNMRFVLKDWIVKSRFFYCAKGTG